MDDDSPDGTAKVVRQTARTGALVSTSLSRQGDKGLGRAYVEGLRWALKGDYETIFLMDCDFSHDPRQVEDLMESSRDHDLVIGSRSLPGARRVNWPFFRFLLSACASLYIRLVLGPAVADPTAGFKCFRRRAIEALDLDGITSRGYIFHCEVNYKLALLGLKIKEVPITFCQRKRGHSKMGKDIIVESLIQVPKLRFYKMTGKLLKR